MARYVSEFNLTQDGETIFKLLSQKLAEKGYNYIEYEYENVFKKGDGIVSSPCFIKLSFSGDSLKLEAWIKSCLGFGVLFGENKPNKALKTLVNEIEQLLIANASTRISGEVVKKAAPSRLYPAVQQPIKRADFAKNYMSKSISREYTISAIVMYILSGISVASGLKSENMILSLMFLAVAGLGVLMHLTKNSIAAIVCAVVGCLSSVLYYVSGVAAFGAKFVIESSIYTRGKGGALFISAVICIFIATIWLLTAISMFITVSKSNKHFNALKNKI